MLVTSSERRIHLSVLLAFSAVFAGCGSSPKSPASMSPGLPTPPIVEAVNQYVGTASSQSGFVSSNAGSIPQGGLYTVTIDDSKNTYSYLDVGVYSPGTGGGNNELQVPYIGTISPDAGFLSLLSSSNQHEMATAVAIEIPGRALLLRPNQSNNAPVIAVGQNVCATINGGANFLFVAMPGLFPLAGTQPSYGSVQIATSGPDWTFSKFTQFTLSGASISTIPLQQGVCSQTLAGQAVSVPADLKNDLLPITVAVGPSGYFILDQNSGSTSPPPTPAGGPSLVGVIQPSAAIDVNALTAAKYLGFFYEAPSAFTDSAPVTETVAFGRTAGASGTLVGGAFPQDNPQMTPTTDTVVTLGARTGNGTFAGVEVTRPDPRNFCMIKGIGTTGTDGNGNPTCTFPAVAVAGNPEGKFAVFLYAQDYTSGVPMGLYLYQQ